MRKRKREAQGNPASRERRSLWTAGDGGVRTGWLLAASLFAYTLVTLATRYGLIRAFSALFGAWGIDAANIHRAPAWARLIYVWHGSIATLVYSALTLLLSGWLRRSLWRLEGALIERPTGKLWRAGLAGILGVAAIAALCLLPDSMRPEWPLTAPRLTWTLPVMAVFSLISTVAGETFTKRVLYDGLRCRWNGLWAVAVVCGVSWLNNGAHTAGIVGSLNILLLGWVGCLLYARYGIWTSVGFRWGWSFATAFLLGFGGGDEAVYRLYGVSETLLTGGDAGPMRGLWATLLLAGTVFILIRKNK